MMPQIHLLLFLLTSLNNKDMPCLSKIITYPRRQISTFLSLLFRGLSATWQRALYRASKSSRRGATLGGQNPFKRHVFQALSFSELNGKAVLTRSLNHEKVFWILPRFPSSSVMLNAWECIVVDLLLNILRGVCQENGLKMDKCWVAKRQEQWITPPRSSDIFLDGEKSNDWLAFILQTISHTMTSTLCGKAWNARQRTNNFISQIPILTCYPGMPYVLIRASGKPNTLLSNRVFIRSCHLPFSTGQWRKELAWDANAKLPSRSCLISDPQLTGDMLKPPASLFWAPSCNGSRMASLSKDDPSLVRLPSLQKHMIHSPRTWSHYNCAT